MRQRSALAHAGDDIAEIMAELRPVVAGVPEEHAVLGIEVVIDLDHEVVELIGVDRFRAGEVKVVAAVI